jgi:hypothetical protein
MGDQGRTGWKRATLDAVLYLFALIGMAAVVAAVWVALRSQPTAVKRPRVLPPDDDPEFLRRLNEQRREPRDDGLTG